MSHNHHDEAVWGKRLIVTMAMNIVIPAVQITGGVVSGSMALISDALHNLGDLTSLLISYLALRMGQRSPTLENTFGFKRLEVLAAAFNVALLYGIGLYIAVEGWLRLKHPQPIEGRLVLWIAFAAFFGNIISALLLHSGAKVNINMRGAFFHMLTDAMTSLGVTALGWIWLSHPWYWLDPVMSWIIVALIFYSGWGILKDAFLIFMNATPPGIDLRVIQKELEALEGIKGIHHLHIWQLSQGNVALAAHIVVPDQMISEIDSLVEKVKELLACRFKIDHPTLQFETKTSETAGLLTCPLAKNSSQKKASNLG
ncbi:MAG: cation diffusion facilitator family transporter [Syntrophales bacterium LBB04]|nr:cation diffusion facilitator family transporter [Syntrophales bacterium LBB04]